jgi:hypothetical protein
MNLDELKKYECEQLTLEEVLIDNEDIKWGPFLTSENEIFRITRTVETLEQYKIIIPMFIDEEMLPFGLLHKNVFYPSYCHFSDYVIDYKKAHLMKITQRFGIKLFKLSEEKHLEPVIAEKVEHHFKFDFVDNRWKYIETGSIESDWIPEKDIIEELSQHEDVRLAGRGYFSSRKQVLSRTSENYPTYQEEVYAYYDLVEKTYVFFELKKALGEITRTHHDLIKKHLDAMKNKIIQANHFMKDNALKERIPTNTISKYENVEHNDMITYLSDIKTMITRYFDTPAYWVIENNLYPNIAVLYQLTQKAEHNRNNQTKFVLKQKILEETVKTKNNYVPVSSVSK